ncbi:MAG: 7-cyano-7-deazaguanine synthase QueC [Sedimentisphaerales bacterium]|nr:7-cyano-7-deazaguanine synthase QueC [Sedimentisphaerales bacterium]
MARPTKKAVILLSGGLDSYTAARIAQAEGFVGYALTVDYGQRHRREIDSARRVARALRLAGHKVLRVDLRALGGSALTDDVPVPKRGELAAGIPVTYVPARNTILLSLGLAWAEVLGAFDIFLGVNAVDYSGYPDCRPEFVRAYEALANLATRAAVEDQGIYAIHAPLIELSKGEIIRRGLELGLDYSLTHSCYDPDEQGRPCGRCDSCVLRRRGFADLGLQDPLDYVE